ncbi:MAG: aldehyde dehydrogenase family protein, partial [Candidatus Moranbacteria bacterium]|nr:aldehyde dehydrogenase family protein [Candidatus Moranbacteria bacterium]
MLQAEKIKEIILKQKSFFKTGKTKEYTFRLNNLKKIKELVINHEKEIYKALNSDLKKSKTESYLSEIGPVLTELNFYIKNLKKWIKPQKVKNPIFLPFAKSYIKYEPLGICSIFATWNYPVNLSLNPLISSIAAGNCSALKVSEKSGETSRLLAKMLNQSFNENYLKVIEGNHQTANHLLEQKVDLIFFSGSSRVGKTVMRNAANNLTPLILELGGKSPCIVDKETDIKKTAQKIVWGKFLNSGQTCIAPDYLLVHREIKPELIENLKTAIEKFFSKDPRNSPDFSKIINIEHFERLNKLLNLHRENVIYGGKTDKNSLYISPTLLVNLNPGSEIQKQEIFGPLLPIIEINSIDEAIEYVNKKPKPLTLYIFSKNKKNQITITKNTSSGSVSVNEVLLHIASPYLPFGGVGKSGMGRY